LLWALIGITLYEKNIQNLSNDNSHKSFSIIIPFRNEEQRINLLLNSITNQNYCKEKVEWIFIDDFSEDNTTELIHKTLLNQVNFKIYKSKQPGKKYAQLTGVKKSTFNYLIFTDADVQLPENYLHTINKHFAETDLMIMPVSFIYTKSWISKWSYYEQQILNALNVGFGYFSKPLFANGANLAITKKAYLETLTLRNDFSISSGDDVFLLQACRKLKKKIKLNYTPQVVVYTLPPQNLKELIYQKIRWALKMKLLPYDYTFIVGITILIFNLLYIILPILILYQIKYVEYFTIIFLFKMMIDKMLLFLVVKLLKTRINKPESFIISALYPFYQWIILFAGIVFKSATWKGRKVN
jgi:cellulose synthase/poly-beta-1,6-N-acetylglucosamine synthase-like glycosyltransferase